MDFADAQQCTDLVRVGKLRSDEVITMSIGDHPVDAEKIPFLVWDWRMLFQYPLSEITFELHCGVRRHELVADTVLVAHSADQFFLRRV